MPEQYLMTGVNLTAEEATLTCYVCKREENAPSGVIHNGEPEIKRLKLKKVDFGMPAGTYRYLLCDECVLLFGAFAQQSDSIRVT